MTGSRKRTTAWALGLAVVAGGTAAFGLGAGTQNGEWRYYSGDNGSRKYSPLDQITRGNVAQLRVVWRSPAVEPEDLAPDQARPNNLFRSTPIMVNGVLYASSGVGSAIALDPATGRSIWRQPPDSGAPPAFTSNRGVAYWSDGASGTRILAHRTHHLYALDPKTGARITSFMSATSISSTPPAASAVFSEPLARRDLFDRRAGAGLHANAQRFSVWSWSARASNSPHTW